MKIINSLVLLSIGTAFGIGMVLSCSDNSPRHSDAATCDCPASEAPIAGRTVVKEGTPEIIQPGQLGGAATTCTIGMPPGTQFLSGSCELMPSGGLQNVALMQFGYDKASNGWFCDFKNNELVPVTVVASVLCLTPAP